MSVVNNSTMGWAESTKSLNDPKGKPGENSLEGC